MSGHPAVPDRKRFAGQRGRRTAGDADRHVFSGPVDASVEHDDLVLRRAAEQLVVAPLGYSFDEHLERAA